MVKPYMTWYRNTLQILTQFKSGVCGSGTFGFWLSLQVHFSLGSLVSRMSPSQPATRQVRMKLHLIRIIVLEADKLTDIT